MAVEQLGDVIIGRGLAVRLIDCFVPVAALTAEPCQLAALAIALLVGHGRHPPSEVLGRSFAL
jgi:hypothetical protein